MKNIKLLLVILLISVFVDTCFAQEEEAFLAKIESVSGMASVLRASNQIWDSVRSDMSCDEGDQIAVANASTVILNIDGSVLTLSEGTLFTLEKMKQEKEFKLWQGMIRAKVRKLSGLETFEVVSPEAVCAVRGTEFSMLSSADNNVTVKTYSGSVNVKNLSSGKEVLVKKGQQCTISPDSETPQLSDMQEKENIEEPEKAKEKSQKKEKKKKQKKALSSDATTSASPKAGWSMNGSMGADVLKDSNGEDKIYYSLNLLPELSFWKFGIGLDINLYFDEEGNMREEEWDGWEDLLSKVYYVRYGQSGDRLYALLGGLKSYTLGHGFIMNNYTNMLNYPQEKYKGLIAEVNFEKMGIHAVVSDLDSYPIIGGRLYYKPLMATGIPLVKKMSLGISAVSDYDPDKSESTDDDDIMFYGADAELPIVSHSAFSSMAYFDIASYEPGSAYNLDNIGKGWASGVGGTIIKFIDYGFEYRKMDQNFLPRYFDSYYDVDRSSKAYIITDTQEPSIEGSVISAGLNFINKLTFNASYEDYNEDIENRYPYLHSTLTVDPALLMNKYSLRVSYDNKNVHKFSDISELEGAIMTTEIGYNVAPNVMMYLVQRQTFDENGEATKTMSFRTRFTF